MTRRGLKGDILENALRNPHRILRPKTNKRRKGVTEEAQNPPNTFEFVSKTAKNTFEFVPILGKNTFEFVPMAKKNIR